jgi:hypothetical protein
MANNRMMRRSVSLAVALGAAVLGGCAANNPKPVSERGWIGGEYRMARVSRPKPAQVVAAADMEQQAPKSGLVVGEVATNAPAGLAGLQPGDYIVEVDQKPVASLKSFLRVIDGSKPGTWLPVKVWRSGGWTEIRVCVGRETFRKEGLLMITLPTVVHGWDFWYGPAMAADGWYRGLSLVVAGYESGTGRRVQLDGRKKGVYSADLRTWFVIMEVSKGKRILSQEVVPPQTTWLREGAAGAASM